MSEYYGVVRIGDAHLEHHGIKGQKWGVRRYDYIAKGIYQKHPKGYDYNKNGSRVSVSRKFRQGTNISEYKKQLNNENKTQSQVNKDKVKKAVGIGIAVAGAALATYGVYKLHKSGKINFNSVKLKSNNSVINNINKFEPERIKIDRIEPERIKIDRIEPDKVDFNKLFDGLSTNGQKGTANNSKFDEAMKNAKEYTEQLLKRRRTA